jgi:hypothetical protein
MSAPHDKGRALDHRSAGKQKAFTRGRSPITGRALELVTATSSRARLERIF